jgi:hypothetical protein
LRGYRPKSPDFRTVVIATGFFTRLTSEPRQREESGTAALREAGGNLRHCGASASQKGSFWERVGYLIAVHFPELSLYQTSYSGCENVHPKWFGKDVHAGIEMAVAQHSVLSISGNEQNLQIGPCDTCSVCHLSAVQPAW